MNAKTLGILVGIAVVGLAFTGGAAAVSADDAQAYCNDSDGDGSCDDLTVMTGELTTNAEAYCNDSDGDGSCDDLTVMTGELTTNAEAYCNDSDGDGSCDDLTVMTGELAPTNWGLPLHS